MKNWGEFFILPNHFLPCLTSRYLEYYVVFVTRDDTHYRNIRLADDALGKRTHKRCDNFKLLVSSDYHHVAFFLIDEIKNSINLIFSTEQVPRAFYATVGNVFDHLILLLA